MHDAAFITWVQETAFLGIPLWSLLLALAASVATYGVIQVVLGLLTRRANTWAAQSSNSTAQALADVVAGVKDGKKAVVSGFVDSTGNAAQNEELAKQRAFAVRDQLKALGVAEDSIELKKPENIEAGAGAQARRVEVNLV